MTETEAKRYFLINAVVNEESMRDIIKGIHAINRYDLEQESSVVGYKRKPIDLVVETYGGDCYTGMALVNSIIASKTPVYTYSYGKTMSMGIPIFGAGHLRFASPDSTFMLHQGSGGVVGTIEHMLDSLEEYNRLEKVVDKIIFGKSKLPKKKYNKYKKLKKDWFFSGKKAYKYGLVDVLLIDQSE